MTSQPHSVFLITTVNVIKLRVSHELSFKIASMHGFTHVQRLRVSTISCYRRHCVSIHRLHVTASLRVVEVNDTVVWHCHPSFRGVRVFVVSWLNMYKVIHKYQPYITGELPVLDSSLHIKWPLRSNTRL